MLLTRAVLLSTATVREPAKPMRHAHPDEAARSRSRTDRHSTYLSQQHWEMTGAGNRVRVNHDRDIGPVQAGCPHHTVAMASR